MDTRHIMPYSTALHLRHSGSKWSQVESSGRPISRHHRSHPVNPSEKLGYVKASWHEHSSLHHQRKKRSTYFNGISAEVGIIHYQFAQPTHRTKALEIAKSQSRSQTVILFVAISVATAQDSSVLGWFCTWRKRTTVSWSSLLMIA